MLQEKSDRIYSSSREYILLKKIYNTADTHVRSEHRNDNVIYYGCTFCFKNIDLFQKNGLQSEYILFPYNIYLYQKIDGPGFA